MNKKFTHKTLLRYYYQELSPTQNRAVAHAISTDMETKESYREICMTLRGFNSFRALPSMDCINRILDYSQRRAVVAI